MAAELDDRHVQALAGERTDPDYRWRLEFGCGLGCRLSRYPTQKGKERRSDCSCRERRRSHPSRHGGSSFRSLRPARVTNVGAILLITRTGFSRGSHASPHLRRHTLARAHRERDQAQLSAEDRQQRRSCGAPHMLFSLGSSAAPAGGPRSKGSASACTMPRRPPSRSSGLTASIGGPGINRAREPFELDPELAWGEDDRFSEWSDALRRGLFPLGEIDLVETWVASFGAMPHAGSMGHTGRGPTRLGEHPGHPPRR
ncbi:hypothetical protein SAMN04489726_1095 [Allokutzneria albata]|uniref:Uncharacterized protein n=1 Tax=Allokutzneria albata TaxID=211114 RepID=A0A1G9SDV0_ALLAB|nr:hypothetical protein SAMN04489726_1095 [Allokutzneria albata]